MQTVITVDDFDFIIAAVNDTSQEILQKQEAKQEDMYNIIEVKLWGVQHDLLSSHTVSIAPLPSGELELGDEPTQLQQLVDATEAHLRHTQEET